MKKIFFYINTLGNGGAERVMVNLADFFSNNNYDVTLITSFKKESEYLLSSKTRRISLEKEEIKQSRFKRNLSRISKLRKICKEERPDILIAFMAEPNLRAILATRGVKVKTLVSVRNTPDKEYAGRVGRFIGKVLLPIADACVFQTKDAQEWFPKRLQKKSRIIYNAVKKEFYQVDRTPICGEIITCGRLVEQKNHMLLINAFAEVIKMYPYITLKIYGEGPLRKLLQNRIDELHLSKKAFLMGAIENVENALKTASLFVLPSDYEGMPNALMEAMAAGVPCIATDCPCGGPRELLSNYSAEKLVPCGDVQKLSEAICKALQIGADGSIEKKLAEAFYPEHINTLWEDYILDIIGLCNRRK